MLDYDNYDPPVDETVTLRCGNTECFMYYDPEDEGPRGETWHPTTFTEYQGVEPHGGYVNFHDEDSFACPECGQEGEEIN